MKKLTPGMHIRVVSPSASIEHIGGFEANLAAKERLEKLGFTVSFSEHYLVRPSRRRNTSTTSVWQ